MLGLNGLGFGANELKAFRAVLSAANSLKEQGGQVSGTERDAGFVKQGFRRGLGISCVERNDSAGKFEISE